MRIDSARSLVVGSIVADDAVQAIDALASAPAGAALVELRADRLRIGEVERVVREIARPVLVSARRRTDGGAFDGSEDERRALLEAALAAGAALVDVEWDAPCAVLADAAAWRDRVIVSHHGGPCRLDALRPLLARLLARRPIAAKLVPHATRVDDVLALRTLLEETRGQGIRLAAFATGAAGVVSRILANAWGSFATYGALDVGRETAPGQLPVDDLLSIHRVLELSRATRLFGLVGARVSRSPSPAMHAAGYRAAGIDACYLPIESDELEPALALASALGLEALGATRPFKEAIARGAAHGDAITARAGSANTLLLGPPPTAFNTDGPAAVGLVRRQFDPRGARVAIVGAGGTARAFAAAFADAGSDVTLFGRSPERTERAAREIGVRASSEPFGARPWEILLHATPRGQDGERWVEPGALRGRVVLDAVYAPQPTALARDARARGLAVVDGLELLAAQGRLQFERMTGCATTEATLEAAARGWIARRAP
jgi:3-dehydroquinate dehydratase/shikimate dehydrogenase